MAILRSERGFTLIEMSVVLVIIGLIIGSVVIGRSLIRQSQVMSIITDEQFYYKAALAFRDKYNALPGDMANATSFWGAAACPQYSYVAPPQTATCNGNGNGMIDSDGDSNGSSAYESYGAWQQLADAGFIKGIYTGAPGPYSTFDFVPGLNTPVTRIEGTTFQFISFTSPNRYGNGAGFYSNTTAITTNQQYLAFGGVTGHFDAMGNALTPQEAQSLDLKIDDGYPVTGMLLAGGNDNLYHYCDNSNATTPDGYNSIYNGVMCRLIFAVNW